VLTQSRGERIRTSSFGRGKDAQLGLRGFKEMPDLEGELTRGFEVARVKQGCHDRYIGEVIQEGKSKKRRRANTAMCLKRPSVENRGLQKGEQK